MDVCRLIYQSTDPKLLASLSGIPYTVGRSFSQQEAVTLAEELRRFGVSFHFKSTAAEGFDISFDPEVASREAQTSSGNVKVNWRDLLPGKIFAYVLAGLGAAVVLVVGLSRVDFATKVASTETVDQSFRASVEKIEKDVEFRKGDGLVWSRADLSTKLSDTDAIRTFDKSSALLKYREGSTVNVRPNTLMVIGANENPNERSIQLEDGSLQARLKPSAVPQRLRIKTKAGTLEMKSPQVGEVESRVETSVTNGQMKVAVSHGSAVLQPLQPGRASVEIKSFEQVEATTDKISSPTKFEPTLRLISPSPNAEIQVDPQAVKSIEFAWEDIGPETTYTWMMSTDEAFKNILLTQSTSEPRTSVNFLDLGVLYWRVIAKQEGTDYKSSPSRINVQKYQN